VGQEWRRISGKNGTIRRSTEGSKTKKTRQRLSWNNINYGTLKKNNNLVNHYGDQWYRKRRLLGKKRVPTRGWGNRHLLKVVDLNRTHVLCGEAGEGAPGIQDSFRGEKTTKTSAGQPRPTARGKIRVTHDVGSKGGRDGEKSDKAPCMGGTKENIAG